jgi:hypothetical protein
MLNSLSKGEKKCHPGFKLTSFQSSTRCAALHYADTLALLGCMLHSLLHDKITLHMSINLTIYHPIYTSYRVAAYGAKKNNTIYQYSNVH